MEDVRMLLRVLVMLLPLPVFWALFDQQVSCSVDNILVHVTTEQTCSRHIPSHAHVSCIFQTTMFVFLLRQ